MEADTLRAECAERAREAGFGPLSLPEGQRQLAGTAAFEADVVIAQALEAVAASSATWLRAGLAREIAARLPATAASSAGAAVEWVDRLVEVAASRCVELHPPPGEGCRVARTAGR